MGKLFWPRSLGIAGALIFAWADSFGMGLLGRVLLSIGMAGTAMTAINFFTMIGPAVFLQGLGIYMQTLYPQSSREPEAFTASLTLCALLLFLVSVLYLFTKDTIKRNPEAVS